jgi:hypothetical protein
MHHSHFWCFSCHAEGHLSHTMELTTDSNTFTKEDKHVFSIILVQAIKFRIRYVSPENQLSRYSSNYTLYFRLHVISGHNT